MNNRRQFLTAATAALATAPALLHAQDSVATKAAAVKEDEVVLPPRFDRIMLSCKYGMTKGETIEERFQSVKDAGFDGIDFDDCGNYTAAQVRKGVNRFSGEISPEVD